MNKNTIVYLPYFGKKSNKPLVIGKKNNPGKMIVEITII